MKVEILPLTEEDYKEIYGSYEQNSPFQIIEKINFNVQERKLGALLLPFNKKSIFSSPAVIDELEWFLGINYIKNQKEVI